jgi:hypothetical protein
MGVQGTTRTGKKGKRGRGSPRSDQEGTDLFIAGRAGDE